MRMIRRSLPFLVLSAVVVWLALPAARQAAAPAAGRPAKLALVGGMLLDGYEAGAIHHAAILIDG